MLKEMLPEDEDNKTGYEPLTGNQFEIIEKTQFCKRTYNKYIPSPPPPSSREQNLSLRLACMFYLQFAKTTRSQ